MEDFAAIYKAIENLNAPWAVKTLWHEHGVDFSFKDKFYSEFLPNSGFAFGYCRLPGAPVPSPENRPAFLVQALESQSSQDWIPFTTLKFWGKNVAPSSTNSVRLQWVEENPDMIEYFSLDINDQMQSGTPYDPHTDRYLIKQGKLTIGKIRFTDCGNSTRLATRPYFIPGVNVNWPDFMAAIFQIQSKAKRLLIIEDSVFTEEKIAPFFQKVGEASISYCN